jgi:ArsR family transcriptional regulator, arsenate/arsenite/antimonite-responsive transcriptional repressor
MHKKEASRLFKALSDESRLRIVKILYDKGTMCACKLLEIVDCGQPTLSHHMSVLVQSGLVVAVKDGKWIHYTCNKELVDLLMGFFSTPCACVEKQYGNE